MEKQVIIKRGNSLADTPFTAVPTILASSYNHERVLIRNMGRRLLEDRRPHPSRSGVGHVSHLLQNFSRSIPVKIRCDVFYEPRDGDHQRTRAGRVSAADIILSSFAYRSLLDKFLSLLHAVSNPIGNELWLCEFFGLRSRCFLI